MTRKRLYILILALGFAGQFWIIYSYHRIQLQQPAIKICLFNRVTGIPCPSCGTIHSIISICKGNFVEAFRENPLGYAGLLITIVLPFWVIFDLAGRRESLYRFFQWSEKTLSRKPVLFSFLAVVLLVWIMKVLIYLRYF